MTIDVAIDVAIIGGSFAGLSAAMQLVRAQRKVVVIDGNTPRNRFAKTSHGVFCLDGKTPTQIRSTALSQLHAYPTFRLIEDIALEVQPRQNQFSVTVQQGEVLHAKKVILAFGITDTLPEIPGIREHWGSSVVHCPYCHGYELKGLALGVLATSEMSFHQAALLPDWGVTTLFTQAQFKPEGEVLLHLQRRGVTIEEQPILRVVGDGATLQQVMLADGRQVNIGALYVGPQVKPSSAIVQQLGLTTTETPVGTIVSVDEFKESSIKGLFVAGDLSNVMQNGTFAIASGTMAGIAAHRSLVFDQ